MEEARGGQGGGVRRAWRRRAAGMVEARGVHVRIVSPNLDPDAVAAARIEVSPTLDAALEAVAAEGRGRSGDGLVVQDAGNLVTTL